MKKSLFALTAVLLAGSSAFAMDVTNPFYVPMKGDFLSETSAVYQNVEHGSAEFSEFAETLSYGISKKLAISGTISDIWAFDLQGDGLTGHKKWDNPAWGLGLKYNLVDCCKTKWKVQLGADYEQGGVDHHEKTLSGFVKAGYQLDKVLPYASLTVEKPIGRYEADPVLAGRLAAYAPLADKVNLDVGITYEWDSVTNGIGHDSEWTADATLNYVFSDCISVGLTGSYILQARDNIAAEFGEKLNRDGYALGVNFKAAF